MNYRRLNSYRDIELLPYSYYHDTFDESFHMSTHSHPYLEIMYCRKGEITVEITQTNQDGSLKIERIPIKEKQFILLDAGTVHRLSIEKNQTAFVSNIEWKIESVNFTDRKLSKFIQINTDSFFEKLEGLQRFLYVPQKYIVASDCENLEHCLVYYINLLLNQNDSISTQCNIQARFIQLLTELDKCLSLAGLTSTGIHYIAHAKLFIKNNFNRPLTVTEIAEHTGCTKSYLQRLFNTHIGMSILQYLNNIRIAKCKRILIETNLSIDDICAHVGFNNRQHLIYEFKAQTGITPTAYRNSFDGENKTRHSPPFTEYVSQKIKN